MDVICVGAILFLRLICPSMIAPQLFGLHTGKRIHKKKEDYQKIH
jgi:hypothetical protein